MAQKMVKMMKGVDSEKGMQKAMQRMQKGGGMNFKM